MTSEVKPVSMKIEFTTDELHEITHLLDEAVKAKGIAYAPIALYLYHKITNALNTKKEGGPAEDTKP